MNPRIDIRPLDGVLGAEIHGVDLTQTLTAELFAIIHRAFLQHLVIFFRDQYLTPKQLCAFAARFGPLGHYPFAASMPSCPDVVEIVKEPEQTSNFGGIWHTDTCYLESPPVATLLYAKVVPENKGDTLFANMYLAYQCLPPGIREKLDRLRGVHSAALTADQVRGEHLQTGSMQSRNAQAETYTAEHPLIRIHPESGRKSLYLSPAHTERLAGRGNGQDAALLNELREHVVRPQFCSRFRWQPHSLAMWDNRCTLHRAINDYDGHRRVMQRVTIGAG